MGTFDFGKALGIKNPFKTDGALTILYGVVAVGCAAYLLLEVREWMAQGARKEGWGQAVLGFSLLVIGLTNLARGTMRVTRFYVGRSVPSDLSATANNAGRPSYSTNDLEQTLLQRVNLTFVEPDGLVSRVLVSMFPKLLVSPPPLRAATEKVFAGVISTAIVLLLFALFWFGGMLQLIPTPSDAVMEWALWASVVAILAAWINVRVVLSSVAYIDEHQHYTFTSLAKLIFIALIAPAFVAYLINSGQNIASPEVSAIPFLIGEVVLAIAFSGLAYTLWKKRVYGLEPVTRVSEFRDKWVESVHPMDIFRDFEMRMADHRYMEIPNRDYVIKEPRLTPQGKGDRGEFTGAKMIETQPRPMKFENHNRLVLSTSILGTLLLCVGAIGLAFLLPDPKLVMMAFEKSMFEQVSGPLATWVFTSAIALVFGAGIMHLARLYWSEIKFDSTLAYLFAEGTFTESTVSMGTSVYDSARSENTVVRSSLSPWMLIADLVTTTFAVPGKTNLEQRRWIEAFSENGAFMDNLIKDLKDGLSDHNLIAGLKSEGDQATAGNLLQMNAVAENIREKAKQDAHGQLPSDANSKKTEIEASQMDSEVTQQAEADESAN